MTKEYDSPDAAISKTWWAGEAGEWLLCHLRKDGDVQECYDEGQWKPPFSEYRFNPSDYSGPWVPADDGCSPPEVGNVCA